jgi:hypothetical protein
VNRNLITDTPRNSCGSRTANLQLSAPSETLIQFVKVAVMNLYLLITRLFSRVERLLVETFRQSFSQILLSASEISQYTKKLFKFTLNY